MGHGIKTIPASHGRESHTGGLDVAHPSFLMVERPFNWCSGGFFFTRLLGNASWSESLPQRCQTSLQLSINNEFGCARMLKKKIRGRQTLTLTTSRYLWLGYKTASSWTAGHQSLTWGINFPLLSLLLIFTIVHWLSVVMAFTLGTLWKDAPGGWFRNDSLINGTYLTSSGLWESKRSILHSQDNQVLKVQWECRLVLPVPP